MKEVEVLKKAGKTILSAIKYSLVKKKNKGLVKMTQDSDAYSRYSSGQSQKDNESEE